MKARTLILAVTLLLMTAMTLTFAGGCNMWHGAGEDIEDAGEKMQ